VEDQLDLTAGLYATRGGLKNVVMFEMGMPGGQITGSVRNRKLSRSRLKLLSGMDLMAIGQNNVKDLV
jgi:thioredoxin reductase (NADPH)